MLKESFLELVREIKKHMPPEIFDCILFGSFVKGKSNPRDIDVLIISKEKDPTIILKFVKKIEEVFSKYFGKKVNVNHDTILLEEFYSLARYFYISDELLVSGYSIREGEFLAELFGFIGGYFFLIDVPKNKIQILKYYLKKLNAPPKSLLVFSYKMIFVNTFYYQNVKDILEYLHFRYREFPILLSKRLFNLFSSISKKELVFSTLKQLKNYL